MGSASNGGEKTLKGLKFPFLISNSQGSAVSTEEQKQLESDLKMLLVTEPGSRPFFREYGVGLSLLLQEPNDDLLQALMKRRIVEGVTLFEDRILLKDVQFKVSEDTISILILYEWVNISGENTLEFNINRS